MLTIDIMQKYIQKAFVDGNIPAAVEGVRADIQKFFNGEYGREMFKLARKITKEDYASEPGHIRCWKRVQKRIGKDAAPKVGERFEYMVANKAKAKKIGDNMVDWVQAEQEKIGPDMNYYFNASIVKPMTRVMEYMVTPKVLRGLFNPMNYDQVSVTHASSRNLLGFLGVQSSTTKRKKINPVDHNNGEGGPPNTSNGNILGFFKSSTT